MADCRRYSLVILATAALLIGCAKQPAASPAVQQQPASILVSSSPVAGSTVRAPVDELKLHFNPPARLDELTVSGPDGTMPMMVHAVGEISDYTAPLPGLAPGAYTVNWRAGSGGREYRGSFGFTVR